VKLTFLKRPKAGVTTWLGRVMPKAGAALMLGMLATVISPAAAQAEKLEARVCLHIPQGHNYFSVSGFEITVKPSTAGIALNKKPVKLLLTADGLATNDALGSLFGKGSSNKITLPIGYTCKVFTIGTEGGMVNDFELTATTQIDAKLIGNDDICADELYIQKVVDGVVVKIARFLNANRVCWGDDFPNAKITQALTSVYYNDGRKFVDAIGRWAPICRTTDCDSTKTVTIGYTVKVGNTLTNASSTTIKNEVSAGIKKEGFEAGTSMSKSTTNSVSKTVSTDITNSTIKTRTVNLGYKPEVRRKLGVVSVWEYVIYSHMSDGSTVAVPTGFRGCSNADTEPKFGPGSPDVDLSCQGALNAVECAQENGECTFTNTGTYHVFYGVSGNAISKIVDRPIMCTNDAFGHDPALGENKRCWGYSVN
jgi:hypothetical protein